MAICANYPDWITRHFFIVTPQKGGNRGWCYTHPCTLSGQTDDVDHAGCVVYGDHPRVYMTGRVLIESKRDCHASCFSEASPVGRALGGGSEEQNYGRLHARYCPHVAAVITPSRAARWAKQGMWTGPSCCRPRPGTIAEFTTDALRQCREQGVDRVWICTVGDPSAVVTIAEKEGFGPSAGKCPCLYIADGGFPHNLHRWIEKLLGQL